MSNVTEPDGGAPENAMPTYFLSKTLKYLYLLFSPDALMPLDEYVFNSGGHPFKIWKDSSLDDWIPYITQHNTQ